MLKPYKRYKSSGVEWLSDVPEHWTVKAIKWESPVLRRASPRPIDNEIYFDDDGEYAWVRIADVTLAGMYLRETIQRLSNLGRSLSVPLQPGALFLSIAGSVGKPCITDIKCCIHDGFVYFPFWKGESRFLYYMFASGEPYKGLGKLGTQLNLNTDTVGSIIAGLPDANEQRTIADFLDCETAKIDTLVGKKRSLIEKLEEKRTALISRTVTLGLPPEAARASGLNPHPKLKPSGIPWLGDVPAHWQVSPLKFLVATPVTDGPHVTPEILEEGIPFVSAEAISNGRINFEAIRGHISREDHQQYSKKYKPRLGDIYMVKSGATTGRVAMVETEADFNIWSPLAAIRCSPALVDRHFLYLYLQSREFQTAVELSWTYGTQQNIGMGVIQNLNVPVPPLNEQSIIAKLLSRETAKIDGMVTKVEAAIERLQEYRSALITAAVTGKIDVRGTVA